MFSTSKERNTIPNIREVRVKNNSKIFPLNPSENKECLVWGAFARVLHVSRLLGVAPLRLTRVPRGWRASISKPYSLYSYALLVFLHICGIYSLIRDLHLGPDKAVRTRGTDAAILWVVFMTVMKTISTVCVYENSARMRGVIEYLKSIGDIHFKYKKGALPSCLNVKVAITILLTMISLTMYSFGSEFWVEHRDGTVSILSMVVIFDIIIGFFIEIQFVFAGLLVESTLHYINYAIKEVNFVIKLQKCKISNKTREKIDDLFIAYGTTFDGLRQLNGLYSNVLVMLCENYFLQLVVAAYYYVGIALNPNAGFSGWGDVQVIFLIRPTLNLILITEPGYRIQRQWGNTQMRMSQLLRLVKAADPLVKKVDLFHKQISLNRIYLSIAGLCTLDRSVIAGIISGVTACFTLILQFQETENLAV